ncbi:hypothetical protein ACFLV7_01825 [Chloroflexota bacterium]
MVKRYKFGQLRNSPRVLFISAALVLTAVLFSGCEELGLEQADQTPQPPQLPPEGETQLSNTWIEFPPDGGEFPLEPLTIVVYAANENGIGAINLQANGQEIPQDPITPINPYGTLVRMDSIWMPPAEGEYILEARSGGGSPAYIRFCIGSCQRATDTPVAAETPTPTLGSPTPGTETATLTPTVTSTTDASQPVTIDFWVDPPYINASECASLNWYVEGAQTVYLDGSSVSSTGVESVCPCENTTYNLNVEKPDSTTEDRWASLEVYGSCDVETEEPPTPEDTTGPDINSTNLIWESCEFFGQASVSDASGVSWAKFYFNLNDHGWGSIWMSEVGGGSWISDAGISVSDGIGTPIGTIEYYMEASDTLGNPNQSSIQTYDYMSCSG